MSEGNIYPNTWHETVTRQTTSANHVGPAR